MIIMKNIMSTFGIDKIVRKGKIITSKKCIYCNAENDINVINKLNKSKIYVFKCKSCGNINNLGNIYNFKSGKTLNNRLDSRYNNIEYDKHEWSQDYDNL